MLVDGNAGNAIGLTMRRGLIAIGGSAGDLTGFNMIAGTILVCGDCGIRPGAGMRRGMLGLFGNQRTPLLPSFRYTATHRPQILSILLRNVQHRGLKLDDSLFTSDFDFYQGDLVSVGRGEIVFPNRG